MQKTGSGPGSFCGIGPDDSCTPACFRTRSAWPKPDTVSQNQIKSGPVLHNMGTSLGERNRIEYGKVIAGRFRFEPGWMSVAHWFALTKSPRTKIAAVQESSGSVPTEGRWPAINFPISHLVPFFQRRLRTYCAKLARIRFNSGQVLAKQIRPESKPVCSNHRARFWPNETGPLLVSRIRFGSVLPKMARIIVRNRPGSDLGLDGHVRYWPNCGQTDSVPKTQPARCKFVLSDSVPFMHRRPGYYSAKPARN